MSHVDLGKFACAACNRTYPWKPEYAGRKVKCKCGSVITAPTEPPSAETGGDEDDLLGGLYALAADEARAAQAGATTDSGPLCPGCQQEMPVGEAVCPHCSFNLRTGARAAAPRAAGATPAGGAGGAGNPMLAYAGMSRRSAADARAANANAVGGVGTEGVVRAQRAGRPRAHRPARAVRVRRGGRGAGWGTRCRGWGRRC